MNILVISPYPLFDRASGDLRFFQMLEMIAARNHEIELCAVGQNWQVPHVGLEGIEKYRLALVEIGVRPLPDGVGTVLRNGRYDLIIFEFYYHALQWLEMARFLQPQARIVVDSVDVHFLRLEAKAKLSGKAEDKVRASATKREELAVYRRADLVITVTQADADALHAEIPGMPIAVVPNIHPIYEPVALAANDRLRAIFVGSFRHEPNIDGVLFFVNEVWPVVVDARPDASLDIVGDAPPEAIRSLASSTTKVHGWVAETAPYLRAANVSVAPLRFGAGMKGKIGEAMAHGLPVVTTSVGAEGMGLTPGENILVEDDGRSFARAILGLQNDFVRRDRVARAGWDFIREHYGPQAVERLVAAALDSVIALPVMTPNRIERLRFKLKDTYSQHLAWRLPK